MEVLQVNIEQAGYQEKENVIKQVKFSIDAGQMVGLIGANGAGKTTTIKAILGLLRKMKGEVRLLGEYKRISYIPERPILYPHFTLWEHILVAGSAYQIPSDELEEKAKKLLDIFQLMEHMHHFPEFFSKGMQQKVMLILSLLQESDIYIVDEPFMGLDPHAIEDLLALLGEKKKQGAGILLCTHALDTAEKICDSFLLMNQGKLIARGDLDELREVSGEKDGSLFTCFNRITRQ